MKKNMLYFALIVTGMSIAGFSVDCWVASSGIAAYDAKKTMKGAEGQLAIYDQQGELIGTLEKTGVGNFKLYDKAGKFRGIILSSGVWLPRPSEHRIRISPESAKLYLKALKSVLTAK